MIKITIEGWEDEPVVVEAEQFVLLTDDPDASDIKSNSYTDHVFLGYASALIQELFKEVMQKED